jgi:hypothetical protein
MGQPHEKLIVQYVTQTPRVTHWQTTVQNGHEDSNHLGCGTWPCIVSSSWYLKGTKCPHLPGQAVQDEWNAWPTKWRHYNTVKHQELLIQLHCVTSQMIWFFRNITNRTSNPAQKWTWNKSDVGWIQPTGQILGNISMNYLVWKCSGLLDQPSKCQLLSKQLIRMNPSITIKCTGPKFMV